MRSGIRAAARVAALVSALAAALSLPPAAFRVAAALRPLDAEAFRASYEPSTRIYDKNLILLREVPNSRGVLSRPARLEAVSPLLVEAILAAEDERFRRHDGVDWLAAGRAFLSNSLAGRRVSGASTLTMQLARLAYGLPRSLGGKLRQTLDALRLEAALSKNEILEAYLGRVPLGGNAEGVESASWRLFGKSAAALELPEAALLAGMIQAPGLYDPGVDPEAARRRRTWVLERLRELGRIDEAALAAARAAALPPPLPPEAPKAGHFTDYVLSRGGLRGEVVTSLDWGLQELVEAMTAEHARRFAASGISNAAVVVLDNATGGILAMVGSKAWTPEESGYVNGALAKRQPGSTLKPFAYALAFERGYSPASSLADIETEYVSNDRTLYLPRNYSRSFRGPVLAKEALASSLNIPAIRLVRELGTADFLEKLGRFGFRSLDQGADYYGLGLVLGNGEVSLLELAGAYAALARNGEYREPWALPGPTESRRAAEPAAAWLVTSILADEALRVQAFGADTPLLLDFPLAVKTGTSSNWRDSWTAGYTREFTIAVWAGDFEASSMNQVSGSIGAGPLFHGVARLMESRLGRLPTLPEAPAGIRQAVVCAESGLKPNAYCPRKLTVALAGDPPKERCAMHRLVRYDARDGSLASATTPAVFLAERVAYDLPPEYALWLKESGKNPAPAKPAATAATAFEGLSITSPRRGDIYIVEPGYDRSTQSIELALKAAGRPTRVAWYLDGRLIAEAPWPYSASWRLERGVHELVAKAEGLSSPPIRFEVR